jgi:membrane-bound serine protease (ClpP class)
MEMKYVSDTRAWARSLAELRNRNADWAALAVTDSDAIVAEEALDKGVIEVIAADLDDLLLQIDGRTVELPQGRVRIATANVEIRTIEMWWGESLLSTISNPNVAFLLLILGFYGILFEFYSPGWGVSGTLGIVCLLLGFFALAVLPVSYAGLALIFLALGLFVAEAYVTSFGALTLGGCICLILGGLMLVESPAGFMRVSWTVILPMALATALITLFLLSRIVKAHRSRVQTGGEGLCGQRVMVRDAFDVGDGQYRGLVFVHGEYWQASSALPVAAGAEVEIKQLHGLILEVHPVGTPEEAGPG